MADDEFGLWVFSTEDGDPWGGFLYGHKDVGLLTLEKVNDALDDAGHEPVEKVEPKHLWMVEDDEGGDHPWNWCDADTPGAVAITAVQFT